MWCLLLYAEIKDRKAINPERSHPPCQIMANLITAISCFFFCWQRILDGILKAVENNFFTSCCSNKDLYSAHTEHFGIFQLKVCSGDSSQHEKNSQEIFISNLHRHAFMINDLMYFNLSTLCSYIKQAKSFYLVRPACLRSSAYGEFINEKIFMEKNSY